MGELTCIRMSKHNFKGTLFLTLKVQYGPLFIQIEMIAR
jgi:hypothetical protein